MVSSSAVRMPARITRAGTGTFELWRNRPSLLWLYIDSSQIQPPVGAPRVREPWVAQRGHVHCAPRLCPGLGVCRSVNSALQMCPA